MHNPSGLALRFTTKGGGLLSHPTPKSYKGVVNLRTFNNFCLVVLCYKRKSPQTFESTRKFDQILLVEILDRHEQLTAIDKRYILLHTQLQKV